jgi:outer membrane protein OmpA-like peptidoglycan-associated protein
MTRIHHGLALALVGAVALAAAPAGAQIEEQQADFNAERLRPSMDRNGIIDVESGTVGEHLTYDAALWVGYGLNPLVLIGTDTDGNRTVNPIVAHRIGANLVGSISLFDWVEVGLDIPVIVFQARDGKAFEEQVAGRDLSYVGLGEIRLSPKVRILREREMFLNLAVIPSITAPTAFPRNNYFGDPLPTFVPEVAADKHFGDFRVAANLAARLRVPQTYLNLTIGEELLYRVGGAYSLQSFALPLEIQASLSGVAGYPINGFQSGFEVLGGVVYTLPVLGGLQVFGDVGFSPNAVFGMPTARVLGGARWSPRVVDADADGILDDKDACKDQPEDKDNIADSDGCPETDVDNDGVLDEADKCNDAAEDRDGFLDDDGCIDADNDGDNVLDVNDKCPGEPEDYDGDNDADGCYDAPLDLDGDGLKGEQDKCPEIPGTAADNGCPPADKDKDGVIDASDKCPDAAGPVAFGGCPDGDHDGIPDLDDKCPTEPETINGKDDLDGCPDLGVSKVKLTAEKIEFLETVLFDTNKDVIKEGSFSMLRQAAAVLKANPQITKVRVGGHTDNQGDKAKNLELSDRRARAVRAFLINEGVVEDRLTAQGFGDTQAIADNKTKAGREKNRRVELVIVEIEKTTVEVTK